MKICNLRNRLQIFHFSLSLVVFIIILCNPHLWCTDRFVLLAWGAFRPVSQIMNRFLFGKLQISISQIINRFLFRKSLTDFFFANYRFYFANNWQVSHDVANYRFLFHKSLTDFCFANFTDLYFPNYTLASILCDSEFRT